MAVGASRLPCRRQGGAHAADRKEKACKRRRWCNVQIHTFATERSYLAKDSSTMRRMCFCGGTRRSRLGYSELLRRSGSCLNCSSIIYSPWCAMSSWYPWRSFSSGPMLQRSSRSKRLAPSLPSLRVIVCLSWFGLILGFVLFRSPPHIPEVKIPEDLAVNIALALRFEINCAFSALRDIASGRDLQKFLAVIAGVWVLSIVGSYCNFLTLFYIVFVLLHTVPIVYEKYEDKIDAFGEKATIEIKKEYALFHAKVLSKISRGALKGKKH